MIAWGPEGGVSQLAVAHEFVAAWSHGSWPVAQSSSAPKQEQTVPSVSVAFTITVIASWVLSAAQDSHWVLHFRGHAGESSTATELVNQAAIRATDLTTSMRDAASMLATPSVVLSGSKIKKRDFSQPHR
jgi:hypothetical protein